MHAVADVQLYLVIGIPTFAVLVGILTDVVQYNATNARFASIDMRLASLETRLSSFESRADARFNQIETKLDALTCKIIDLGNRVTRIEAKLGIG